jgi:hypothetical protein
MFTEPLLRSDRGGHRHRESRLTTEELLDMVFSLWLSMELYKEDNSLLRTVVSSQPQDVETRELEHLFKKPLPMNSCLHSFYLTSLFLLSGIMSPVYVIL